MTATNNLIRAFFLLFICISGTFGVSLVRTRYDGYTNGSECSMQHTLRPNRQVHGKPQYSDPPYQFNIQDKKGKVVSTYKPGKVYTLQLLARRSFRGFLIQPRLATKDGFIIGHLRGGRFLPEVFWVHYGIKIQECLPNFNNSITHQHWEPKFLVRAKWRADANVGPVQFFLTIYEDEKTYWETWQPTSGFLVPKSSKKKTRGKPLKIAEQKPPPVKKSELLNGLFLLHSGEEKPTTTEEPTTTTEATTPAPEPIAEPEKLATTEADTPSPEGEPISEPEASAKTEKQSEEESEESEESKVEAEPIGEPEGSTATENENVDEDESTAEPVAEKSVDESEEESVSEPETKSSEEKKIDSESEEEAAVVEPEPEKSDSKSEEDVAAEVEPKKSSEADKKVDSESEEVVAEPEPKKAEEKVEQKSAESAEKEEKVLAEPEPKPETKAPEVLKNIDDAYYDDDSYYDDDEYDYDYSSTQMEFETTTEMQTTTTPTTTTTTNPRPRGRRPGARRRLIKITKDGRRILVKGGRRRIGPNGIRVGKLISPPANSRRPALKVFDRSEPRNVGLRPVVRPQRPLVREPATVRPHRPLPTIREEKTPESESEDMDCLKAGTCFTPNLELLRRTPPPFQRTPPPIPRTPPPFRRTPPPFRHIPPPVPRTPPPIPRTPPPIRPTPPPRRVGPSARRLVVPEFDPEDLLEPESVEESSREQTDNCKSNPCLNGGTCQNIEIDEEDYFDAEDVVKHICICRGGWTGEKCEVKDFCYFRPCVWGVCTNEETGYSCECDAGVVGKDCNLECPGYLCENGATCILTPDNEFGCDCRPGTYGDRCEKEIDECESQPCLNGGTCTDGNNDFQCACTKGYMGKQCHRPCQNIYRSCATWDKQNLCDIMRPRSDFFDINCAVSCKQCDFDNDTVVTDTPLPPVLEPFEFLLGVWSTNSSNVVRVPKDFAWPKDATYQETISFTVSKVPMFGTPALNFTAIARNNINRNDIQITNGFLTIRPKPKDRLRAALMTVGNDGTTTVEEGPINALEVMFTPTYFHGLEAIEHLLPETFQRSYILKGIALQENIVKTYKDGRTASVSKYFTRQSSSS